MTRPNATLSLLPLGHMKVYLSTQILVPQVFASSLWSPPFHSHTDQLESPDQ